MSDLSNELERRLAVARAAARQAGEVCAQVRAEFSRSDVAHKTGREPVTVADYVSQAWITSNLRAEFPDDGLIAEEGARELRDGEHAPLLPSIHSWLTKMGALLNQSEVCDLLEYRGGGGEITWVVDPIDGTKGFLRGDQYAVAIGFLNGGRPVAGVLGCPAWPGGGEVFFGLEGGGAWREAGDDSDPVLVSERDSHELRILASVESGHGDPVVVERVRESLGIAETVRVDSQAKYGYVASGGAEIYLRPQSRPGYQEKVWDHAAGVALVEAGGGRVTDLDGRGLDFSRGERLSGNRGVVATHGRCHDDVLAAVQAAEAGR